MGLYNENETPNQNERERERGIVQLFLDKRRKVGQQVGQEKIEKGCLHSHIFRHHSPDQDPYSNSSKTLIALSHL